MQSRSISKISRVSVAVAVSLILAFMPFTVNLEQYRITLERNEAQAIAPVFAGALAFLEEAAAVAGFASVGDFVATGAGVIAVGSGMTIGTAAGMNFGDSASQNLGNLVDAADYPAWDTLSSSQQSNWGTKENYDAAKYNSLMSAFGLSSDYENYKSQWGSGSNFEFSSSGQDRLEQLGTIGQNWINGAGNTIESIREQITNQNAINQWMPLNMGSVENDPESQYYASGMPPTINFYQVSEIVYKDGSDDYFGYYADRTVYGFWLNNSSGGSTYKTARLFSTLPFKYGTSKTSMNSDAIAVSSLGNTFYYAGGGVGTASYVRTANIPNSGTINLAGDQETQQLNLAMYNILYGQPDFSNDTIDNYPGTQIENNEINQTVVYFPISGIDPDTTWDEFLEKQENVPTDLTGVIALLRHIDSDLHQFNFYNDGQLKVHDQGVWQALRDIWDLLSEIADNIGNWNDAADAPDIIGDFDFDELDNKVPDLLETISDLAPFGSILLLSEMYSIMANYTEIDHPQMVFPFEFGGLNGYWELVIDLSWLDDIKPLINFFCIAMLIIAIANATIRIVEIEAAS